MNAAPTICRGCGAKIDVMDDGHLCSHCRMIARADDSDLTQKLWRLRRSALEWQIAWAFAWRIWFVAFAFTTCGILVYWLVRQLL